MQPPPWFSIKCRSSSVLAAAVSTVLSEASSSASNNPQQQVSPLLSFLFQEVSRLNALIQTIDKDCEELHASFSGAIASSERLDTLMASLTQLEIPAAWRSHSFPTLRPLRSWLDNIAERGKALEQSAAETHQLGVPRCVWLSGLFAPQAVAACALRLHASRTGVSLESLALDVEVTRRADPDGIMPSRDGIFVRGMLLEGARWDSSNHVLAEQNPLQHEAPLPILLLRAVPRKEVVGATAGMGDGSGGNISNNNRGGGGGSTLGGPLVVHQYSCPLYFTHVRGVAQHVFDFDLPTIDPVSQWTLRGVCAVLEPPSSTF